MKKLGIMMVGKDEEITAAASLLAAIPYIDYAVYVDTGSTDKTIEAIERLCYKEIKSKKLLVKKIDIGESLNMGKARSFILDKFREQNIEYFLKLDADEICYQKSLSQVKEMLQNINPDITAVWFPAPELYQHEANTSREWLENILNNKHFFEMKKQQYGKRWLCRVKECSCSGNWTDESRGKQPEGIRYPRLNDARSNIVLLAHYGWARPMNIQKIKAQIRYGNNWNERVNRLHLSPYKEQYKLTEFKNHPETLLNLAPLLKKIIL